MKPFTNALVRIRARLSEVFSVQPASKPEPLPPLEWIHVLPGDAIVVNLPPGLTGERRAALLAQLEQAKRYVPDGVKFIVADASMRVGVVRGVAQ